MARVGQYGWSPRQMERINARRMERGREPLVNLRNIKTDEDLDEAQNMVASAKDTRKPVTMDSEAKIPSMKFEAEERTKKFREKFSPKGAIGIKAAVGREVSKLKGQPLEIERSYKVIG